MPAAVIDGEAKWYPKGSVFIVQTKRKGRNYKNAANFGGNLAGAVIHFTGINIDENHAKRITAYYKGKHYVLARSGVWNVRARRSSPSPKCTDQRI